jgi:hypothetical protein
MISNVRQFLAAVPAVSVALLSHVGVCPACWPLIGGLISSLGLTFLVESQCLLPLMIGCLVVAIAALGWGARRNYWPLILGVVASGAILIGKSRSMPVRYSDTDKPKGSETVTAEPNSTAPDLDSTRPPHTVRIS